MQTDYSRSTAVPAPPSLSRNLGLLLLRLTAGGSLLFWYGGREALTAWAHIWHKSPWGLPAQLTTLGFPVALPAALVLVTLTLLGSLFIIIGLLTRLSAISLGMVAGITAILFTAYPEIEEQALLYCGLCFAIALCGPGLFAMDRILRATAGRRP